MSSPWQHDQHELTTAGARILRKSTPGHARKMAAKMEALGNPVYFYESEEGGQLGRGNLEQRAFRKALIYTYLQGQLR